MIALSIILIGSTVMHLPFYMILRLVLPDLGGAEIPERLDGAILLTLVGGLGAGLAGLLIGLLALTL